MYEINVEKIGEARDLSIFDFFPFQSDLILWRRLGRPNNDEGVYLSSEEMIVRVKIWPSRYYNEIFKLVDFNSLDIGFVAGRSYFYCRIDFIDHNNSVVISIGLDQFSEDCMRSFLWNLRTYKPDLNIHSSISYFINTKDINNWYRESCKKFLRNFIPGIFVVSLFILLIVLIYNYWF